MIDRLPDADFGVLVTGTQVQEVDGDEFPVYQFDGTVAIDGGMAGAEDPCTRLTSPLADELRGKDIH